MGNKNTKEKSREGRKILPVEYIIELWEKGNTQVEIAKIIGCSREAVNRSISRHDIRGLEVFKKNEPKVWSYWRRKIFGSIKESDIKNASLLQKVTVLGIMVDKEKVLSGKIGENTGKVINIEHLHIAQQVVEGIGRHEIEKVRGAEVSCERVKAGGEELREVIDAAYEKALRG